MAVQWEGPGQRWAGSPVDAAYESILEPICREIGRQAPVPPYRGPVRLP